jgi:hypothetical protein
MRNDALVTSVVGPATKDLGLVVRVMSQNRHEAYEQGYFDGLRTAHADVLNGPSGYALKPQDKAQPTGQFHPAYHRGFHEGLKDGTEVLIALGKTARMRQI